MVEAPSKIVFVDSCGCFSSAVKSSERTSTSPRSFVPRYLMLYELTPEREAALLHASLYVPISSISPFSTPSAPRERHARSKLLNSRNLHATTFSDRFDEALVDLIDLSLEVFHLFISERAIPIRSIFAICGGDGAHIDAEQVEQLRVIGNLDDRADRADARGFIGIDIVGLRGNEISRRALPEAVETTIGFEKSFTYCAISSPAAAAPPPEFTRRTTALMDGSFAALCS